jgi:hypothetical protein
MRRDSMTRKLHLSLTSPLSKRTSGSNPTVRPCIITNYNYKIYIFRFLYVQDKTTRKNSSNNREIKCFFFFFNLSFIFIYF